MTTRRTRRSAFAAATVVAALAASCAGGSRSSESSDDAPVVAVTVLTSRGCATTDAAIRQLEDVAARLGIATRVERTIVETQADAVRLRLLGSPTFLVAGHDLDPAARDRTDFALT